MNFEIDVAEKMDVDDNELRKLLFDVYVNGGYINPSDADKVLNPANVRDRGIIFAARSKQSCVLAGISVWVPYGRRAIRFAKSNEVEFQLLAVKYEYRGLGLGTQLVKKMINMSKEKKYSKVILWTQVSMQKAQHIYTKLGFLPRDEFEKNNRKFTMYELQL